MTSYSFCGFWYFLPEEFPHDPIPIYEFIISKLVSLRAVEIAVGIVANIATEVVLHCIVDS